MMATITQPHCIRRPRPLLRHGLLLLDGEPPGSLPLAGLRFLALPLKRTIFVNCLQPRLFFFRQDRLAWVTNCFLDFPIVIAWKREGLGETPSGHGSTRCAHRTRVAVSAHAGDEPLAMRPALRTALALARERRAKSRLIAGYGHGALRRGVHHSAGQLSGPRASPQGLAVPGCPSTRSFLCLKWENIRPDRPAVCPLKEGLAPSHALPMKGQGKAPPPQTPPPMEGVDHPLQTSPAHAGAIPGRGRGCLSTDLPILHQTLRRQGRAVPPIFC